jgi:hypothetical protein
MEPLHHLLASKPLSDEKSIEPGEGGAVGDGRAGTEAPGQCALEGGGGVDRLGELGDDTTGERAGDAEMLDLLDGASRAAATQLDFEACAGPRDALVIEEALGGQLRDGAFDRLVWKAAFGEPLARLRHGQLAPCEALQEPQPGAFGIRPRRRCRGRRARAGQRPTLRIW